MLTWNLLYVLVAVDKERLKQRGWMMKHPAMVVILIIRMTWLKIEVVIVVDHNVIV